MALLLFSLLLTLSTDSFKDFAKSGHEAVCLVNYNDKTVKCDYKSMNECRDHYANNTSVMCFSRKRLKLKGDN